MAETTALKPVNQHIATSQTREVKQTGDFNILSAEQSTYTSTHSKAYVIEIKGNIDVNSQSKTTSSAVRLAIMLAEINDPSFTVGIVAERLQGMQERDIKINTLEGDFPIKDVQNLSERHRFSPDGNTLHAFNILPANRLIGSGGEVKESSALITESVAREMVIIQSTPSIEAVVITGKEDQKLSQPTENIQIQTTEPNLQVEMAGQTQPQATSSTNLDWLAKDPNITW